MCPPSHLCPAAAPSRTLRPPLSRAPINNCLSLYTVLSIDPLPAAFTLQPAHPAGPPLDHELRTGSVCDLFSSDSMSRRGPQRFAQWIWGTYGEPLVLSPQLHQDHPGALQKPQFYQITVEGQAAATHVLLGEGFQASGSEKQQGVEK